MSKNSQRYANAVKLQYLNYEERKKKGGQKATDYLKFKPSYFTIIPEFVDDMGMLILDNENNKLIYSMRGLDFNAITQNAPIAIGGAGAGAVVGQQIQNVMGGARTGGRFSSTGKLVGAGIGSYLFGNKEVRTALDILLSGAYNQRLELDEETQQVKQGLERRFMNTYINDLNRELIKIREIQNTFPNTKLILAGHSRGAKKAEDLSKMLHLQAEMFNPAETSVYGNILLQVLLPMIFSGSRVGTRGFIRNELIESYDEEIMGFTPTTRDVYDPTGDPIGVEVMGAVYPPMETLTRPIQALADVPMTQDLLQASEQLPLTPERPLRTRSLPPNSPLREYIERDYPLLQANIFNPFPRLNKFFQSETHDFGTFGHTTEGEAAMIRAGIGMNNAPVSLKTIFEAAARYSATRYGGGLIKYSLEKAAGEETKATQLLANPFTLVSLASLSASVINPNERIEVTDPNLNIYRTKDDLVSKGYSDKYNVEDKDYVPSDLVQKLIIGKHSLDHFISKEMFNAVSQNQKINTEQETLNDRIRNRKIPERMSDVFNRDVRERKGSMGELMNKDVRKQPRLISKPPEIPTPPKSQFNIIMPVPPEQPKPVEPQVYEEFKGQDFMAGTPSFKAINPYYLCKEYPNLPGCEDFIE